MARLARALDAGLARMRERHLVDGTAIRSRRDLMSFNIDHFCRPTAIRLATFGYDVCLRELSRSYLATLVEALSG